jgi:Flp pilus assembly protein TadB
VVIIVVVLRVPRQGTPPETNHPSGLRLGARVVRCLCLLVLFLIVFVVLEHSVIVVVVVIIVVTELVFWRTAGHCPPPSRP